jgi:CBS domain-containing protein
MKMKVKECMCNKTVWVKPETNLREVAKIMTEEHIGCIPICDTEEKVIGIVTDRDLVSRGIATHKDVDETQVKDIMTNKVHNIGSNKEVEEAAKIMSDCQIKRVPVVDNNKLVGIITVGDLANNNKISSDDVGSTVQEICNCEGEVKNAE